MINYTEKENTLYLISIQKASLNSTLSIQKNLNKQILTFMKNFIGNIKINTDYNSDNQVYNYIDKSTNALSKSNKNISNIENLIKKLDIIYSDIENYVSEDKVKDKIEKYNKSYSKTIDSIYMYSSFIERFIYDISLVDLSDLLTESNTIEENEANQIVIDSKELDESFVEDTLIISDIKEKVFLPYKLEKIKEILLKEKDKYTSIQDVIDKKYTVPLKNYKIATISRFKEAYKLIVKKEHGSRLKAFSLASELFFNYNLHPAIITACNSLDELDIYLACLEDNTLNDFKFFNVKYEIAPVVTNNNDSFEKA